MKIALIGSSSFLAKSILKHSTVYEIIRFGRKETLMYDYPVHGIQKINLALLLQCEMIIYCVGGGVQPNHEDSETLIEALNYEEPVRLMQRLESESFRGQLITFGSYFEIGNSNQKKIFTETELIASNNPLPNVYCKSKKKLTEYVNNQKGETSYKHLHLILTNIYGVGENANRLLPYLAISFKNKQKVSLTSGQQKRQFTHVSDVAKFILDPKTGRLNGVMNFTHPNVVTVKSIVEKFAALINFSKENLEFSTANKKDTSMPYLALDIEKLKQSHPNFEFKSIADGLVEYI